MMAMMLACLFLFGAFSLGSFALFIGQRDQRLFNGPEFLSLAGALGLSLHGFLTLLGSAALGTLWLGNFCLLLGVIAFSLGIAQCRVGRPGGQLLVAVVIFLLPTLLLFRNALLPVFLVDEFAYQLTAPRAYANEGAMFFSRFDALPNLYFLNQMNTLGMMIVGADHGVFAARVLEVFRCLLVALGLYGVLSRSGFAPLGLLAGVFFLINEEVLRWGASAHVDAGQALPALAALIVLRVLVADSKPASLILWLLAGWFVGSVIAVKQTGVVYGVAVVLALFMMRPPLVIERMREYGMLLLAVFLAVTPWALRSYVYTGNPALPFLRSVFAVRPEAADSLAAFFDFYPDSGPSGFFPSFTHITIIVQNLRLGNVYGALFLIPLAGLFLVYTARKEPIPKPLLLTVLIGALLTIPLLMTPYQRFLIFIYPVALIILMEALGRWHSVYPASRFVAFGVLIILAIAVSVGAWRLYPQIPHGAPVVRGLIPPLTSRALGHWSGQYLAGDDGVRFLNERLGPDDRVLVSALSPAVIFLSVRFSPNVPVVTYPFIPWALEVGRSDEEILTILATEGITHVFTNTPTADSEEAAFYLRHADRMAESADGRFVVYQLRGGR